MNDDQNKNLNTMSLANQDEVPMSIESISDSSKPQTNNSTNENTSGSVFNQKTIMSTDSFSAMSTAKPTPETVTSLGAPQGQNEPDYKNLIEQQAKIISSPESQKINISGGGKGNFLNDNKKMLMITGGVSLAVILLGIGGFVLYSSLIPTQQPIEQTNNQQVEEAKKPLSKEEYLNEISSAEITYLDVKSSIIESFSKFSDPTILEVFYNAVDKNKAVANRLSVITPPEEYKEIHDSLSSYFTSMTYTLDVLGTHIANKDSVATNDLVPILNGALSGIEADFKIIKEK